jgi:hypothetical protein
MKFRPILLGIIAAGLTAYLTLYAASPEVTVYKTSTCGCCNMWVEHLRSNGFKVTVHEVETTDEARAKYGIPEKLGSCHTAVVEGYAIEGHVPAAEIKRLLKERPKATGLAVPGMPMGAPGMDGPRSDPYSVLLVGTEGKTSVYQKYGAR